MRKLSPELENEVIAKTATGWSNREIAAWLGKEHGVTISHQAIAKALKGRRSERADATKAVVREALAKTALSDLEVLSKERTRLRKLATRLYKTVMLPLPENLEPHEQISLQSSLGATGELYLKTVDRLVKVADTKLHYAGADTPDDTLSELAEAQRRVNRRLDSLAAAAAEGEGAPEDCADPSGPREP